MKALIALVLAASCVGGGFLLVRTQSLEDEISQLRGELDAANATARDARAMADSAVEESRRNEKWTSLASRIARLEDAAPASSDGATVAPSGKLADLQRLLTENSDAIADIRATLARVGRTSSAIDETANRLLSAVGGAPEGEGEEGRGGRDGGGLSELLEMGRLMRKDKSELTDEELAQREEMAAKLRARQTDWTLRGFDRGLETKLTDPQRQELSALLTSESAELERIRERNLSDEERKAAYTEVRSRTDASVAEVLTEDQQASWTTYRSRSSRRGFRFR